MRVGSAWILTAAVVVAAQGVASAAEVAAHRAAYTVKMGTARGGFVDARGTMTLVMERGCDGWILAQDMTMELATADGGVVQQSLRFAGWESLDGTRYRFTARSDTDGTRSDSNGRATLDGPGKAGRVVFTRPEPKTIALPEGSLFPVGHTSWLIDRARSGVRSAPGTVFDGTDGEGPQQVGAFIGARVEGGPFQGKGLGPLVARPGWTIRLAFFKQGTQSPAPDYEIEVIQLDNGVAPYMVLDYPDFSIVLELKKIEAVPAPSC